MEKIELATFLAPARRHNQLYRARTGRYRRHFTAPPTTHIGKAAGPGH
jgi:hypothetical protein